MKKLLFIFISLNFILTTYCQDVILKLFVEDNIGREDSITFGIRDLSNLGIDSVFGEKNIYELPFDSLDMRIIQRDSLNHNCLRESYSQFPPAPKIYFPNNIDSKVDYRPYEFGSINFNFEIFVNCVEYPAIIKGDFSGISMTAFEDWSAIFLLDSNCAELDFKAINDFISFDTLFVLPDSSFTTLIVNFDVEVGINRYEFIQPIWDIFPNPTKRTINIYGLHQSFGLIEIVSILGQRICTFNLSKNEDLTFNIENIQSGIYLVRYLDPIERTISIRKFIKE